MTSIWPPAELPHLGSTIPVEGQIFGGGGRLLNLFALGMDCINLLQQVSEWAVACVAISASRMLISMSTLSLYVSCEQDGIGNETGGSCQEYRIAELPGI